MSRFFSHVNSAKQVVETYNGQIPLSSFLKQYFAKDKKFGSRDRRVIAALCYGYFRICNALQNEVITEAILTAAFIFNQLPEEAYIQVNPSWQAAHGTSLPKKLQLLHLDALQFFPLHQYLSNSIDTNAFGLSMLIQPDLFIRIRPGKELAVVGKLNNNSISFSKMDDHCLALDNGIKLDGILDINREYVVQDYNSQQVFTLLQGVLSNQTPISIWDCCAASGGKSILAKDLFKNCQLTVSDVRESILINLHKRFSQAGITDFISFEMDLAHPSSVANRFSESTFDLVICDAPCSGSGTWSRAPEQLRYFNAAQIEQYSQLQKKIAGNVVASIKPGGYLLYITCSVFFKENEEVVQHLVNTYKLLLINEQLFTGYDIKADTMFTALLKVGAE